MQLRASFAAHIVSSFSAAAALRPSAADRAFFPCSLATLPAHTPLPRAAAQKHQRSRFYGLAYTDATSAINRQRRKQRSLHQCNEKQNHLYTYYLITCLLKTGLISTVKWFPFSMRQKASKSSRVPELHVQHVSDW